MDLIIGKDGYGAILVLTERYISYCIIEKLPHGKNAKEIAKAVIRLLYAYRLTCILTITTDNGSEFSTHQEITRSLKDVVVYFVDSYCYWQRGLVEYTTKLIRQYIPKGTDFHSYSRILQKDTDQTQQATERKIKILDAYDRVFQTFSLILHLPLDSSLVFNV